MVVHENALKHALALLGGRKLVFSNAPRHYVTEVLRIMGMARTFDAVYTIEDARFRGKPAAHGFLMLLRKHHLDPHRCAFIDDALENLRCVNYPAWFSEEARHRIPDPRIPIPCPEPKANASSRS
jgi:putative hydrolase of the HAD superfamily